MQIEDQTSVPSPSISVTVQDQFVAVLERLNLSLVLSTRPNHIVFLGAANGKLTLEATPITQPLGLAVTPERIAVATVRSVIVFANASRLAANHPAKPAQYDAFFVPRTLHFTGECHMHDMVFFGDAIIGTNTNFSCICRIDGSFSFTPLWRPNFISKLRPEDRCHLNGFAGQGGKLRYVTALATTDTERGWRNQPDSGGILIEAETNRMLRDDLCMPHSPRLVGEELYLLNGGKGEVLRIDRVSGEGTVLATLPGFTHGLCERGGVLFVGLSQNRISRKENPPPIAQQVDRLIAGVAAIETKTGKILGVAEFNSGVSEVYDVQALPGIRRAGMHGLVTDGGFVGIDTPQTVLWMERKGKEDAHLLDVAVTGNYFFSTLK
ncbi:MAG: hypothetical protein JWP25_8471 [Bradyrhizobium sp.]|nr:hypothetical protein [Bradyrhizobium sp.]